MSTERTQLTIANEQDGLTVAAILVKNNYVVKTTKVKVTPTGKSVKIVLEYWKED